MSHEIGAGQGSDGPRRDEAGVPDDRLVKETEAAEQVSSSAARAFDLRRIIGGLFVVYGVIVGIYGLVDGAEASEKAEGIDINLWSGLAMLLLGIVFLVWERLNPVMDESADAADAADSGAAGDPAKRHQH
jgi:hypothetical protein